MRSAVLLGLVAGVCGGMAPTDDADSARRLMTRAAYLQTQKGDVAGARELYEQIVANHAGTPAAELARRQLGALDGQAPTARRDAPPARRRGRGRPTQGDGRGFAERLELRAKQLEGEGRAAEAEALRARIDRLSYDILRQDQKLAKTDQKGDALTEELRQVIAAAREEGLSRDEVRDRLLEQRWKRLETIAGHPLNPAEGIPPRLRKAIEQGRREGLSVEQITEKFQKEASATTDKLSRRERAAKAREERRKKARGAAQKKKDGAGGKGDGGGEGKEDGDGKAR